MYTIMSSENYLCFLLFQLSSAIASDIMPFTNYTYDFRGMIDYIFYPKHLMQPVGLLGPVDEDWLKENKILGCPQPHITSGNCNLSIFRLYSSLLCISPQRYMKALAIHLTMFKYIF